MKTLPEESFPPMPDREADLWADVLIDLSEKLKAKKREQNRAKSPKKRDGDVADCPTEEPVDVLRQDND